MRSRTYTRKQFSSHIQCLIDHGASQSVTGQLIRGLGEGVLLEAGMNNYLFIIKPSVCSWLEGTQSDHKYPANDGRF